MALAPFAAAQLGLALAYGESTASAVWPPAGIALFFDLLDRALALARRHGWELAVLFVDVDGSRTRTIASGISRATDCSSRPCSA